MRSHSSIALSVLVLTACARSESRPPPTAESARLSGSADWSGCSFPPKTEYDEAWVVLRVTVTPDGKASKVEVVHPVGEGFDEAAAECAWIHSYSPGRDSTGAPIEAVTKPFRVHFVRPAPQ